jgi:hypothetical protein
VTPESFIDNITGIVQTIITALGPLGLAIGTAAFAGGKMTDNPGWVAWGRRGWLGGGIALAATAVGAMVTNIVQRVGG